MKTLHLFKSIAFIFVLLIGGLAILSSANPTISSIIPLKPYIVLTGSMHPTIFEGSVVFINRNEKKFKKEDIITFIRPDKPKENVTHRIVKKEALNNKVFYYTKGDANKSNDAWKVKSEAIWGKVIFTIPLIGYVISFSKTKLGVILTIALPLTIIILDEIRVIYIEIKKRRLKKLKTQNLSSPNIIILLIMIPLLFISSANSSFAFFSSTADATDLIIQTNSWSPNNIPTPTPTPSTTPSCGGNTEINITGNGAGSTNTVNVSSNCSTTINQSNTSEIKTDINISSTNINNQSSSNSANPN